MLKMLLKKCTAANFYPPFRQRSMPEIKNIRASNYVDIGWQTDARTGRVIVMSALDNLVKGAAGQAVQNMNLMFGFAENEGLQGVPMFP